MDIIRKIVSILAVLVSFSFASMAAPSVLKGKIISHNAAGKEVTLGFASVRWSETSKIAMADADGKFQIEYLSESAKGHKLIASFMGYISDTLYVAKGTSEITIELKEDGLMLDEASVKGRKQGSFISSIDPLKTEVITVEGLCKMACCNLAESFENTATISVGFSDAVSGARQIRMLGLAGIYTQLLDENVPIAPGMAATFGLGYVPGQWLESIQVSKGTSSVINGYESIAGQINLEHRKPDRSDPLFINLFASSEERFEGNAIATAKFNEHLSTAVFLHGSVDTRRHDMNGDGFMDMPKLKQMSIGNRWLFKAKNNIQYRLGFGFTTEDREGGQMPSVSSRPLYETIIDNQHFNAYAKMGIPISGEETSLGLILSYHYHDGSLVYGDQAAGGKQKSYIGTENTLFANVIFQSAFGDASQHHYSVGGTYRYDDLNSTYMDDLRIDGAAKQLILFDRNETIAGGFAEYTYSPSDKLSFIAGARADYNSIYGTLFTPRMHFKYTFLENSTIRASAGRGYRTANLIADNMGLLANSRRLEIQSDKLNIEEAWTYGASFTQNFPLGGGRMASVSLDAFRSDFKQQIIIDVEQKPIVQGVKKTYIYNLDGASYANNYQIDFSIQPFERFNIFTTFRYTDNKQQMKHGKVEKPLIDRYKALINLAYATKFEKWKFDFTAQLNGKSRLPNLDGSMDGLSYSEAYPMFYAQVTKKFRRLDIYVGVENIFNYMQDDPIIDPENPFGERFDASVIWGPLMGRVVYGGIRLKIGPIQ